MKKILSILTVLCICGISAFAQKHCTKREYNERQESIGGIFSPVPERITMSETSAKSNTHIIAEMIAGRDQWQIVSDRTGEALSR